MLHLIRWSLLLLPTLLVGVALGQNGPSNPFELYDKDKNGKLSRDEMPEKDRDLFDQIDTDKDGEVTKEEAMAFIRKAQEVNRLPTGFPIPNSVTIEREIPYAATTNPKQTVDLLLPKKPKGDKPLPVVAFIHGGAWQGGDKTMGLPILSGLVSSGDYAGVAIGYRLSGEAKWPAQIFDVKAAIRWIKGNAKKYNLDPERICVMGGSAGGHLVAMLGTTAGVAELEGDLGEFKGMNTRVRCVVDEFGPTELLAMGEFPSRINHNGPDSPESRLLGGPIQTLKVQAKAASPMTYITKEAPPFLIIHGSADPIVPYDQSVRFHKGLKNAGVEVYFIRVEGGEHGGFHNPELAKQTRLFIDKILLGKAVTINESAVSSKAQ